MYGIPYKDKAVVSGLFFIMGIPVMARLFFLYIEADPWIQTPVGLTSSWSTLKIESHNDANFVVIGGTGGIITNGVTSDDNVGIMATFSFSMSMNKLHVTYQVTVSFT